MKYRLNVIFLKLIIELNDITLSSNTLNVFFSEIFAQIKLKMESKIFICNLEEIKKTRFIVKWVNEWKDEVIVYLDTNNKINVKSSICPHFGGEIVYDKNIKKLKCLWHDWKFCPTSGKCLTFPIKGKLNPYDFEVTPKPLKTYKPITDQEKIYAIKK